MKSIFIALLIVGVVLGAKAPATFHQKRLNNLSETKLGRTLLNLITLHSAVAGPV
jgi:hypothetical protein